MQQAGIVKLFSGYKEDREQEHTRDAGGSESEVNSEEGGEWVQAELVADKLGLHAASEHSNGDVNDNEAGTEAEVSAKELVQSPGDKDGTGAEDGEGVDDGGTQGEEECVVDTQQGEGEGKCEENEQHHQQLSPDPAHDSGTQTVPDGGGAFPGGVGQLRREEGDNLWERSAGEVSADNEGNGEEQRGGGGGGEGGHDRQQFGRERGGERPEVFDGGGSGVVEDRLSLQAAAFEPCADAQFPKLEVIGQSGEQFRQAEHKCVEFGGNARAQQTEQREQDTDTGQHTKARGGAARQPCLTLEPEDSGFDSGGEGDSGEQGRQPWQQEPECKPAAGEQQRAAGGGAEKVWRFSRQNISSGEKIGA